MVSIITENNSWMRRMGNESDESDFPLYPDPANIFSQVFPFSGVQSYNMDPYPYPRPHEGFSPSTGINSSTAYAEASQYLESPDIRSAPSNYSTASGHSQASSTMGSPNSITGHIVPLSEWASHGLGANPSIAGYDNYPQGSEYTFQRGTDDFALEFQIAKPNGFVGECQTSSRSASSQHGSLLSNSLSSSSSTFMPSADTVSNSHSESSSTPRSIASPKTPVSAIRAGPAEGNFDSPSVSTFSSTPSSARRPSQAFSAPFYASSSTAGRTQDIRSPTSAVSQCITSDLSPLHSKHHQSPFFSQSSGNFVAPLESSYPSILHPFSGRPASATQSNETSAYPPPTYPSSPGSLSAMSRSPRPVKQGSQSPYFSTYPYPPPRRPSLVPSLTSHHSYSSQDGNFSGEDNKEKGRCTYPDCGKVFKDLKAHMLTHQNERPEKCPIQTCDYHIKGFARKYDKNRHTLTHYKGTMVCGFCPGSGSAAEKSFNRADVFKRHLTSVHAVEQTPPNSRKKTSGSLNSTKKLSGYAPDATGKCSTCSGTFSNAQDFYEHLDDCVLRIVQQEEPSEAINAARLAEVEQDQDVHETLRNNALPTTTSNIYSADEEEEEEDNDDENDDDFSPRTKARKAHRNPSNGVQKSRGLTHSKGGVTLTTKGRKKRKDYPSSWGCPTAQMKMKKRVLCVFDGPRRLWKDDMMLDTDYEVRMKLSNEKAYVTDLDVQTMRRADAFHNSTEDEKGPWIADDLTGMDLEKLMEVKRD